MYILPVIVANTVGFSKLTTNGGTEPTGALCDRTLGSGTPAKCGDRRGITSAFDPEQLLFSLSLSLSLSLARPL